MNGSLTHPDQKTAAPSAGCLLFDKQRILIFFVWKGSPLAAFRAAVVCCVHKIPRMQAQSNQYTSHPKDPSEPDKQFGIPRDLLPSHIQTVTTRQDCRGAQGRIRKGQGPHQETWTSSSVGSKCAFPNVKEETWWKVSFAFCENAQDVRMKKTG